MEGYDVLTTDDDKVGRVAGHRNGFLIVETGHLLKSCHAIPETFAHVDEAEGVVRITVTRDLVTDSPKVSKDDFDELAVARHYGLAEGDPAPETAGMGDLVADDPAIGAEEEGARHGIEPADRQRAEIRENMEAEGSEDAAASPAPASYSRSAGRRMSRP
jgi:hypothetical protein